MVEAGDLKVSTEAIVELPIEKVAFMILQNYKQSKSWNQKNWYLSSKKFYEDDEVNLIFAEAWSWLISKGALVKHRTQSGYGSYEISRSGKKALEDQSFEMIVAASKIDLVLNPDLHAKVKQLFLLGDFETACFKAMKEVEVKVRELSGLPQSMIGTALMRKAFHPENGPLTDRSLDSGERHARSDLFSGSIGSFKNPTSHRPVKYEDPNQASEVIYLADLLLRILEDIQNSIE